MIVIICFLLSVAAIILASIAFTKNKDGFDATGLVFNDPPNWFHKNSYNINDWFVYYEPEQLANPECTHYRGEPQELNWLSSTYRFWRM